MDRERHMREGRLSLKEKELKKLELKIRGLADSIRACLDTAIIDDYEDLDVPVAFQEMADLFDAWADYKGVLKKIAEINRALGQ